MQLSLPLSLSLSRQHDYHGTTNKRRTNIFTIVLIILLVIAVKTILYEGRGQSKRSIESILLLSTTPSTTVASSTSSSTSKTAQGRGESGGQGGSSSTAAVPVDGSSSAQPSQQGERNFRQIGKETGTDKVRGPDFLQGCLNDKQKCRKPNCVEPKCRTGQNHFYHTMYQSRLGAIFSKDDTQPFQFVEIGYYHGSGYDAYTKFMPRGEGHSIEISCLPEGPQEEGKWPFGNFARTNPRYQELLDTNRLHCGDANDYEYLNKIYTTQLKRPNAPPLKLVIDDGAHIASQMATTLFFWFPRIEPGGLLVIEDIQPIREANDFRIHVLPQIMKDIHYCGDPAAQLLGNNNAKEKKCFPTLQPFMQSVHCEMHICVFERNDKPSVPFLTKVESLPPPHAFNAEKCLFNRW